ncbi:hypothetical protein GCM10025762_27320 [Haloechinothrix salitolerans]
MLSLPLHPGNRRGRTPRPTVRPPQVPDTLNNVAVAVFVPGVIKFSDCVPENTLDQTLSFAESAGRGVEIHLVHTFLLVSGHVFTVRDVDGGRRRPPLCDMGESAWRQ